MASMTAGQASTTVRSPEVNRNQLPADAPVTLIGSAAEWFSTSREGQVVLIRPNRPLPRRCMFRPAALFDQARGFPDVNTVMGRLLFVPGTTDPQRYTPFTCDANRRFRELFLLVESSPNDELITSGPRWKNYEAVAKRLLTAADVPWKGLPDCDIDGLVESEAWDQPLEGCVLHALTQWTHARGHSVIEIGSLRGRTLTMLARALREVNSDSMLISIDPHREQPVNDAYVRLAVSQVDHLGPLVQFPCTSDEARLVLRPAAASLIFIDGDHAYSQVVADFENYRELLAPGGCIVFHDYGYGNHNARPDVVPDVRAAIDEHVMADQGFRPLLLAHTLLAYVKL